MSGTVDSTTPGEYPVVLTYADPLTSKWWKQQLSFM